MKSFVTYPKWNIISSEKHEITPAYVYYFNSW